MDWKVPLSDIDFGEEEEQAVLGVLKSRWLTMGAVTDAFEREFGAYHGVETAVSVSSCTAALHLACLALGIGPGDEVIVPSLSFVATANAVLYTGAKPVFADIVGENNLNISPESIRFSTTPRTKAIIVMHYAGYACDMPTIMALAEEHNLYVIEDAAHAVGASLDGKKLGTWGDIGCFSFFSNKNLITGEGGMMLVRDDQILEKVKILRSHGMTSLTWDRHRGHAWSYDVVDLGYNYRLDEIRSSLGRVQLKKLDANNERRRELTSYYREKIEEHVPEIKVPFGDHPGIGSAHIMPVLLPEGVDRTKVMEHMKQHGVQTSSHYRPIHTFENYRGQGYGSVDLPVTEALAGRELTLPLFPEMGRELVDIVVGSLNVA